MYIPEGKEQEVHQQGEHGKLQMLGQRGWLHKEWWQSW